MLRKGRLHRKIGLFGAGYGLIVWVAGLSVTWSRFADRVRLRNDADREQVPAGWATGKRGTTETTQCLTMRRGVRGLNGSSWRCFAKEVIDRRARSQSMQPS